MAAPTITSVKIKPGTGWQQIAATGITAFMRINHTPCHVPLFITVAASLPTGPAVGGFRIDRGSEHFDGAITGNVYARIQNNANGDVDVFTYAN